MARNHTARRSLGAFTDILTLAVAANLVLARFATCRYKTIQPTFISSYLSARLPSTATPTPAGARFFLRPAAVISTAMEPIPEHNSSQAEPKIEEIEDWDTDDLLNWIQKRHRKLLKDDDRRKLQKKRVDGVVFLKHAGDVDFFEMKCGLPIGTSERLADLVSELAGVVQKGKEQDTSTGKSTDHAPLLFSSY